MTRAHLGRTRRSSAMSPIGQQGFRHKRASAWQSPATPAVEAGILGGTPRPSRKDFVAMGAVSVVTLFYWGSRSCHGRYFRVDAECSLG